MVINTHGRHDPCVGIRATPIAESLLALVLIDHALMQRAQNGDVRTGTPRIAATATDVRKKGAMAAMDDPDPAEA